MPYIKCFVVVSSNVVLIDWSIVTVQLTGSSVSASVIAVTVIVPRGRLRTYSSKITITFLLSSYSFVAALVQNFTVNLQIEEACSVKFNGKLQGSTANTVVFVR